MGQKKSSSNILANFIVRQDKHGPKLQGKWLGKQERKVESGTPGAGTKTRKKDDGVLIRPTPETFPQGPA